MITEILKPMAESFGFQLTEGQYAALEAYAALLREWNDKMNLTAITDDAGIAEKHFLDSLTLLKAVDIPRRAKAADVGTGAGFPGVVLKIVRPDVELSLIDSLQKRLTFLEALCGELGIEARRLHLRAEDAGRTAGLRESFDLVTARAVAAMPLLTEYCLPLVKVGGTFAAMKGAGAGEELLQAQGAIRAMGGGETGAKEFTLPTAGERAIITVLKISPTPKQYPRKPGKIK